MNEYESLKIAKYLTKTQYASFTSLLDDYVDKDVLTTEEIDKKMIDWCIKMCPIQYHNYKLANSNAKERVQFELEELNEKMHKLRSFVSSDKFSELSSLSKKLLLRQLCYMKKYADVLKLRLEVWDK